MTFHCFGELALHVFHPCDDAELIAPRPMLEPPIQLGGGAAMAAQALKGAGTAVKLHGLCGVDDVGTIVKSLCSSAGFDAPVQDSHTQTSVVYLGHEGGTVAGIVIEPGGPSQALLGPRTAQVRQGDIVLCPFFPGYAELAQQLAATGARVMLDAGFAPWLPDVDAYAGALDSLPDAPFVVQLSLQGVSDVDAQRLFDAALARGPQIVIGTRGAGTIDIQAAGGVHYRLDPPQADQPIRCAIGAGDTFAAHLAIGLDQGKSAFDSAAHAAERATAKLSTWGIYP
ncbi:MAG: hypothetical protein ABJI96_23510 [Paracoccaceae bacterium]